MGYSKRELINGAFEELGMASYVFDMTPEEYQGAARRLDSMMSEWSARNIRLGYPASTNPSNIDIDKATSVPAGAVDAIMTNLALRIAPSYGKTPSEETKNTAKTGFEVVSGRVAPAGIRQYPTSLPIGAGNRPWGWRGVYFPPVNDGSVPSPSTGLNFNLGD